MRGIGKGADRGIEEEDGRIGEGRIRKDRVYRQRDRVILTCFVLLGVGHIINDS